MNKKTLNVLIVIATITLFLSIAHIKQNTITGKTIEKLTEVKILDLGKWIDARQQGSYYATHPSIIRAEDGNIHITYGSSSEPLNESYAPDWRATSVYATDSIRYQQSTNNGTSWSNSNKIINAATENQFWNYNPDWKIERNWNDPDGSDGKIGSGNGYWEYAPEYSAWIFYQKNTNDNFGSGWGMIQRTQENLWQGPCSNVLIYFKGVNDDKAYYYNYFESYTSPSGILSIYIARASQPQGPYEIWTYDGWKANPTQSDWKPVISPNIILIAGDEYVANNYKKSGQGNPYSLLYGAGLPRGITQKNDKIYLYYIDTTYWFVWKDELGNIHEYGRNASTGQIPYQLVAIGDDPINLVNNYSNRMVDLNKSELWNMFSPKYFPEQNKFYNFELKEISGVNKVVYRDSTNGITWNEENILGDAPIMEKISENAPNNSNNIIELFNYLTPLSDKNGYAKLSDLYVVYSKEHILPNSPVGWKDAPTFKWYFGGTDIYGLKIIIPNQKLQYNTNNATLLPNSTLANNISEENLSNISTNIIYDPGEIQNTSKRTTNDSISQTTTQNGKEKNDQLRSIFIKRLICRLSNLFNQEKYSICVSNTQ